jgi:hypothetical protein
MGGGDSWRSYRNRFNFNIDPVVKVVVSSIQRMITMMMVVMVVGFFVLMIMTRRTLGRWNSVSAIIETSFEYLFRRRFALMMTIAVSVVMMMPRLVLLLMHLSFSIVSISLMRHMISEVIMVMLWLRDLELRMVSWRRESRRSGGGRALVRGCRTRPT